MKRVQTKETKAELRSDLCGGVSHPYTKAEKELED